MTPTILLKRQPAVRSFLSLFSESGTAMKAAVNEAVFAAFQAGRQWGQKPMNGEEAFCVFLDSDIRPSTVRAYAGKCRDIDNQAIAGLFGADGFEASKTQQVLVCQKLMPIHLRGRNSERTPVNSQPTA